VGDIAAHIAAMGFNCVRLTWPTYLATNATLSSLPLRWSLERLGLQESAAGVRVNNPALLDLPLIDVFRVGGSYRTLQITNIIPEKPKVWFVLSYINYEYFERNAEFADI
jgi:hypothetical protein